MSDEIDPKRLIFPGLAGLYQRFSPCSYAIMRIATGAVLLPHGIQKVINNSAPGLAKAIAAHGLPLEMPLAYLTVFVELVGSACLILGLFTRVAALAIWIEMTVIIIIFQSEFGYFWTNRGYEYALLWWLLCIGIFFRGGERCSLDRLIGKEI